MILASQCTICEVHLLLEVFFDEFGFFIFAKSVAHDGGYSVELADFSVPDLHALAVNLRFLVQYDWLHVQMPVQLRALLIYWSLSFDRADTPHIVAVTAIAAEL